MRSSSAGFRLRAPVGDVAGVDDGVDPEGAGEPTDEVEGLRVEVDVAHVQDPDGVVGWPERRAGPGPVW